MIRAEPPSSVSFSFISLATYDLPEPGGPRIKITILFQTEEQLFQLFQQLLFFRSSNV